MNMNPFFQIKVNLEDPGRSGNVHGFRTMISGIEKIFHGNVVSVCFWHFKTKYSTVACSNSTDNVAFT